MGFVLAIAPIVLAGGIAVFVIERLKRKYDKGNLGKEKSKGTQELLNSLIPIGMLFGCTIGIILSMLFQIPLLPTISLGASIGYLLGYLAFEFFYKQESTSS